MSVPLWFVAFLSLAVAAAAQEPVGARDAPRRILEIRSYNLKEGTRDAFHERFVRDSLPLLLRRNIDVVAYGPSLHDKTSYFLMRAFASLAERDRVEEAFYQSREWLDGPRAAVMAAIDSYTTVIIEVDDETLRRLRQSMPRRPPAPGAQRR